MLLLEITSPIFELRIDINPTQPARPTPNTTRLTKRLPKPQAEAEQQPSITTTMTSNKEPFHSHISHPHNPSVSSTAPTVHNNASETPIAQPPPKISKWHTGRNNTLRNHCVAMLAEFVGTFLFLFFAFSATQIAVTSTKAKSPSASADNGPDSPDLLYIALAFGCALATNVWIFFRVSGGQFNPAVTLGLVLIRAVPPMRGLLIFPCQLLGGIAAAGVVSALFPGPLAVDVTLNAGTTRTQGLFIEMFLTIQLVFTVMMLAAEKHRATYLAPLGIGLSLFVAHLTGVYFTGAGVNPARAMAPDVINRSFPGYFWIYWLGPLLGAFVSAGFYNLLRIMGWQTCNPGQDHSGETVALLYGDEESALAAHPDMRGVHGDGGGGGTNGAKGDGDGDGDGEGGLVRFMQVKHEKER